MCLAVKCFHLLPLPFWIHKVEKEESRKLEEKKWHMVDITYISCILLPQTLDCSLIGLWKEVARRSYILARSVNRVSFYRLV